VLGCHFGRSEKPFTYNISKNKYSQFDKNDLFIDMYRSNDVVQMERESVFIRPFVKVGEKAQEVKVFQYFIEDKVSLQHTCVTAKAKGQTEKKTSIK